MILMLQSAAVMAGRCLMSRSLSAYDRFCTVCVQAVHVLACRRHDPIIPTAIDSNFVKRAGSISAGSCMLFITTYV